MNHTPPNHAPLWRAATFVLYLGLLLSFCIWQVTRTGGPLYTFWVVQLLPLLIFIPGLYAGRPRTYIWMCFVLLAYFVKGVDGVASPNRAWIDYVVLVVSVALFISSMLAGRALSMARARPNT